MGIISRFSLYTSGAWSIWDNFSINCPRACRRGMCFYWLGKIIIFVWCDFTYRKRKVADRGLAFQTIDNLDKLLDAEHFPDDCPATDTGVLWDEETQTSVPFY